MELLTEYLLEEALIIIPVLFILGKIIKDTPRFQDWIIPYMLLIVGVILSFLMLGFDVHAFIQGVLVSGAAVFGNELIKQAVERD